MLAVVHLLAVEVFLQVLQLVPGGSSTTLAQGSNANSLLSSRGSILVDTRTNTIIVNDTPSHLKDIKELIDKIDIPVKQVLIEARIVEANSNFEKDLGMRLLLAGIGGSLTYSNTLENGVTINQTGINAVSANPASFVNQNFGISGGASMSTILHQIVILLLARKLML